MASSNAQAPDRPVAEHSSTPDQPLDTIILHVLSPSPEVDGGRITFPSISLDTNISHLKTRIQNSMVSPAPSERQRLIYRGRALVNMDTTLRQVLQSELTSTTDPNPSYTLHLVISPAPGSGFNIQTPASQTQTSQHRSTPPPVGNAQPHPAHPHHHLHFHPTVHPALAQAHAAQAMLQHQLNQLQQQLGMTTPMPQVHGQVQGPGQTQEHGHGSSQSPQIPRLFPPAPTNMQAFQTAITQQQQMRAHAAMQGIHNPAVNGLPPTMPFGQNTSGLGPMTTRVHETVGPDGQRTRVVVNETTIQISRQSTPVPSTNHAAASQTAERQTQAPIPSGPQLPPIGPEAARHHDPPHFPPPHPGQERQSYLPSWSRPDLAPQAPAEGWQDNLPRLVRSDFAQQAPADQRQNNLPPSLPPLSRPDYPTWPPPFVPYNLSQTRETPTNATTAYLLSGPHGPQALVFAPGHGFFTNATPAAHPSSRVHRPRTGLRFQQTAGGRIRPQNEANALAPPALDPAVANAQPQQALEALVQARNVAAAGQANGNIDANNAVLQTVLSRVWTFIKLYFVIFMFTDSGTWFRWMCLFAAALVAIMPSTTVFRSFAERLQARIDGLVPPPPPPRQQIAEERRPGVGAAGTRPAGREEPDPAATAARLVQEHRERHPNVLRDLLERLERGLGLFFASLIPGVGERHVRAREEARREMERIERERERADAEAAEEERKKKDDEKKGKEKEEGEDEEAIRQVAKGSTDVHASNQVTLTKTGESSTSNAGADTNGERGEKLIAEAGGDGEKTLQ